MGSQNPSDKHCPKCNSFDIEVLEYHEYDSIDIFFDREYKPNLGYTGRVRDVEVFTAEFEMICYSCNYKWVCDGTISSPSPWRTSPEL